MSKTYTRDLCSGSIIKNLFFYIIPVIGSGMLQILFNAADAVIVGHFAGDHSLAAVGATAALVGLIVSLFVSFSMGAGVLIGRYFGAKNEKDINETIHTAMFISIFCGILMMIAGLFGAEKLLVLINTPDEILDLAALYLRIYFIGAPFMLLYNYSAQILRAVGDTRRPFFILSVAGVLNIILNVILVAGFGWGVAGVASATVVSQCISSILTLRCLMKEKGALQLRIKEIRFVKNKAVLMAKIGIPTGIHGIVFSVANLSVQAAVNSFGAVMVAGNTAAVNIDNLVYVTVNSFCGAAITFVSQHMGAGKYERLRKVVITLLGGAFMMGFVVGNTALFWGRDILSLFTDNPEVVEAGMIRLNIILRTYCLCGLVDTMVGVFWGLGRSLLPTAVSAFTSVGLQLFIIWVLFPMEKFHYITTIYWSFPITWVLTSSVHIFNFMRVYRKIRNSVNIEEVQEKKERIS